MTTASGSDELIVFTASSTLTVLAHPTIAKAFPRIQFVMTSHSPLITSTLRKENTFVTDSADDGTATIKQLEESVHGRGADQLLLSSDHTGSRTLDAPAYRRTTSGFVPKLREAGVNDDMIHGLLVDNPRRFLAFVPKKTS